MSKTPEQKKDGVKKFFTAELVRETNRRGRTVSVEEIRPQKVPYATFAAIVRGQQLPSWDNAIVLITAFPALADILEIPPFIPPEISNNPLAMDIMRGIYELMVAGKEEDVEELKGMVERMTAKAKARKGNGAASPA